MSESPKPKIHWSKFFSDPKAPVAVIAVICAGLTYFGVPAEKQAQAVAIIGGIFVLASVLTASISYEQGKLNEGTLPDGSVALPPPVTQITSTGPMTVETSNANVTMPPAAAETPETQPRVQT